MGIWSETVYLDNITFCMISPFHRLTLITGTEAAAALGKSRVIVVGLGGVGSWCAEALVRSGVGNISIVDFDTVCVTNINRQAQATSKTVGRLKAEALEERLLEINPSCNIVSFPGFYSNDAVANNANGPFDMSGADYIIDAIDVLKSKLDLIETALAMGKRLFSSMGMALKLDPTLIKTADIWKTKDCSLARLVRQGLRKRNIRGHFTTVYSPERLPRQESVYNEETGGKKVINGSAVTVTATAGMILASLVIRDIYARHNEKPASQNPGGRCE